MNSEQHASSPQNIKSFSNNLTKTLFKWLILTVHETNWSVRFGLLTHQARLSYGRENSPPLSIVIGQHWSVRRTRKCTAPQFGMTKSSPFLPHNCLIKSLCNVYIDELCILVIKIKIWKVIISAVYYLKQILITFKLQYFFYLFLSPLICHISSISVYTNTVCLTFMQTNKIVLLLYLFGRICCSTLSYIFSIVLLFLSTSLLSGTQDPTMHLSHSLLHK